MHRTLERQLRKLGLAPDSLPDLGTWASFVEEVSAAYRASDDDHYLLERAMSVSSTEMRELMDKLADRNEKLQAEIEKNKRTAQSLQHAATHDMLTGLPNRMVMLEELSACLREFRAHPGAQFALLFTDLDDFKHINDSLGHEVGDQVLMAVARRMEEVCARVPRCNPLVCRLGGDEFVILLRRVEQREDASRLAEALQRALESPMVFEHHRLVAGASLGLLFSDAHYREASELLRDADTAMYRAKMTGKGRHAIFDAQMHHDSVARLETEQQLREAIASDAIFLAYQPVVDLESGRVTAFESLMRWRHPARGIVHPVDFIQVAEDTGLILPLGKLALQQACENLRTWRTPEGANELCVTVNVSKRQIMDGTVVPDIVSACERTGVDPKRLIIELTESSVMADTRRVVETLRHIRTLGTRVYMDDFGTGLSSLSTLHQMPFDAVKIDRGFVQHLAERREHGAIIMSVIMLAHNLGLKVVAEGVERVAQLNHLQACDCDYGQGYLFAKPLMPDAVNTWLAAEGIRWDMPKRDAA